MSTTSTTTHEAIRVAATANRLWRASDLGVPAAAMSRMYREGALERIVPGVYLGADHAHHPLTEAAAWTLKHPYAVVGLLTAAVFHDLTDAFSGGTWLFVPKGLSPPRSSTSPVQVVQTAPRFIDPDEDDANGVISLTVHGVCVRVTEPDRTTLDLWRYPQHISAEHALQALRRRVEAPDFHLPALARLGKRLDRLGGHVSVWPRVEPVLQGLMLR
ncbi:MAG: hypothetical protein H6739_40125 [Alphaproteobacteria bacterium]|nr:hypothetical protein [Alphaproteobacteria bacterium]